MFWTSLGLLLLAAALHAFTNALMKSARDKMAFAWWMMGIFSLLGLPFWFFSLHGPSAGWLLVLVSGLLEAIYFVTLTQAYSHGDLSVVYPIARGSGPLFLLIWAAVFLKEKPSAIGLLGIGLIIVGIYLINLPNAAAWNRPLVAFRSSAARWALLTGLLISMYTAVDKKGVSYFAPWVYIYFVLFVCWIALSLQLLSRHRRDAIRQEASKKKLLLRIVAAAILGTAAYTLVLAAMRLSPVSYVGPVREVSVVIGAWIGVRFMSERGGSLRIPASILVAAGILMIAFGG